MRGGVLHDGRDDADYKFCGVQHAADLCGDDDAEGDFRVPWRRGERGDDGDVYGEGSVCADVQHWDGELLRSGDGDGERRHELRGGVLHDGRDDADDELAGIQRAGDDCCDDDADGYVRMPRWRGEHGDDGDVHGEDAQRADVQHRDGDLLHAGFHHNQ